MPPSYDSVIRNGLIYDGQSNDPFVGDIGINDGKVTRIGRSLGKGQHELDASGCIVTPGFIDTHSHLDGNVTWERHLKPNSGHGVTTTVIGNCGVGFAPCQPEHRNFTVELMEGVEDIPREVLDSGLPWLWQTYPEYLDFLRQRRFDMNVAGLLPHSCLRVWVMGERAINGESATTEDLQAMAEITIEAVSAGAVGVGSTRLVDQRTLAGVPAPTINAREEELKVIATALQVSGGGVLQVAPEFNRFPDAAREVEMLVRIAEESGCRVTYSLKQTNEHPTGWRELLDITAAANSRGVDITPQVFGRPTGAILTWECSAHPFTKCPSYQRVSSLPLSERLEWLRRPDFRQAVLSEAKQAEQLMHARLQGMYRLMFPLVQNGEVNYEPSPESSLAAAAEREGIPTPALAYDALMAEDGWGALLLALGNYADGDLEPALEMMQFSTSVLGLADAGAHSTIICDASAPTSLIAYWCRDRKKGRRLELATAIRMLTHDCAQLYGFHDRGRLAVGMKADINIIDFERLKLKPPRMEYDLPAGGRRLVQAAEGYRATLVNGVLVAENDCPTGATPGTLVAR